MPKSKDKIEQKFKDISEKFNLINKYIESGQEVPEELSRYFISFVLSEDPYKDID